MEGAILIPNASSDGSRGQLDGSHILDGSVGTWLLWKHNKNMRFVKNEHFSYSLGVIKSEIYHAGWFEVVT